jgi:hypothetical protein
MCMEDIRLGRALASAAFQFSVTAGAPRVIAGGDPLRTRIAISGDGVGTVLVGFDGAAASATQGFAITPQIGPYVFTVEEWGRVMTGPITLAVAAGTVVVSVVLATLEKS